MYVGWKMENDIDEKMKRYLTVYNLVDKRKVLLSVNDFLLKFLLAYQVQRFNIIIE